jgi:hypothetical protein
MYLNREKEALNFALLAAKKSGKNQVILIFGEAHASGLINLLNTTFHDRIILKECINSSEGFNSRDDQQILKLNTQEATEHYKLGNYLKAVKGFTNAVSFWNATPNSTANKLNALLTSEFNLGSSLFKLAQTDEEASYGPSIPHLEHAMTLARSSKTTTSQNIKNTLLVIQKQQNAIVFYHFSKKLRCLLVLHDLLLIMQMKMNHNAMDPKLDKKSEI